MVFCAAAKAPAIAVWRMVYASTGGGEDGGGGGEAGGAARVRRAGFRVPRGARGAAVLVGIGVGLRGEGGWWRGGRGVLSTVGDVNNCGNNSNGRSLLSYLALSVHLIRPINPI